MDMSNQEVKATCLCGNYQLSLSIPKDQLPLAGHICHCDSCRHGSGTLYVSVAAVPEACGAAVQESLPNLTASKCSTTYHCNTCGTVVLDHLKGQFWIYTGSLDRVEDIVRFDRQIFVQDTLDGGSSHWLKDLSLRTYATREDELPADWPTSNQSAEKASKRLHAHCLCKGVDFWIACPSTSSADMHNPSSDVRSKNSDRGDYDLNKPWWLCANRTKFLADVCACNSCRLASGCDFVQWAFVPTTDITLSADGSVPFSCEFGTLKAHRSSDRATRYFCGQCGADVFWNGKERPGLIDVAVGLLDAAEGSLAQSWLEWGTGNVSFKEDGEGRARTMMNQVEGALQKWVEKTYK